MLSKIVPGQFAGLGGLLDRPIKYADLPGSKQRGLDRERIRHSARAEYNYIFSLEIETEGAKRENVADRVGVIAEELSVLYLTVFTELYVLASSSM